MHAKFEGGNLKIERAVSILVKWVSIMWSNLNEFRGYMCQLGRYWSCSFFLSQLAFVSLLYIMCLNKKARVYCFSSILEKAIRFNHCVSPHESTVAQPTSSTKNDGASDSLTLCLSTSYPGSFHYAPRWRKDPGPGWSRVSQILGDNNWDLWGVGKANVAFEFKTIQGVWILKQHKGLYHETKFLLACIFHKIRPITVIVRDEVVDKAWLDVWN
jgi:hypothetical protein